jgi:hypothetical protein
MLVILQCAYLWNKARIGEVTQTGAKYLLEERRRYVMDKIVGRGEGFEHVCEN